MYINAKSASIHNNNNECIIDFHAENVMCESITLTGPFDKHGNQPSPVKMLTLDANCSAPVEISCRVTIPADYDISEFNPRLRLYLRDGDVCTMLSGSHTHQFDGFHYNVSETYDANDTMIHFTYYVTPIIIARMDRSVVTCGIQHRVTQCFTQLAAMISFLDDSTCTTSTNATTTSDPTTNTHSSTTEDLDATKPRKITMNGSVFFPVVGIVILVGIILLVANGIQLWVIIVIMKKRGTATQKADDVSATNPIALDPDTEIGCNVDSKSQGNGLHVELDQHGIESEDDSTMIPNGTATAPGVIN